MKISLSLLILLLQHKLSLANVTPLDPVTGEECGKPGFSRLSTYEPKQPNVNAFYRTGDIVEYSCENSENILIGPSKRVCQDGVWEKRKIPKCASKIPKSEASYIAGNVLVISVSKPSRISAFTITLYARKTNLNISKVKFLPEYTCNKTFGPEQDQAFLPYSINFVCKSNLVRRSQYREGNFVIVFFSAEISCDFDCSYKLKKDDNVELYEISEDDCSKPDFPVYGRSTSWPVRNRAIDGRSRNLNKTSVKITPSPLTDKRATSTSPMSEDVTTELITPSTLIAKIENSATKLISHPFNSTSTYETTNVSSSTDSIVYPITQAIAVNVTNSTETNKQKYQCELYFRMNVEDSENFDEIMSESSNYVKQFEMCEKNEDWQYVRLPECIPDKYCTIPSINDNIIPVLPNLYLNEFAVINDVISYRCLQETDVNIGGSSQVCLISGNWSGLRPLCVTKNFGSKSSNGIIYLSVSVSVVSLLILIVAVYCAFKLNETAIKAVQVFNDQIAQQNTQSTQSSLNSGSVTEGSYASNQSLIYSQTGVMNRTRQLPKVPSLYHEPIYESVQNVITAEPRYVDFKTMQQSPNQANKRQQPSTWDTLKRKLTKQDELDDMSSTSYRRAKTYSSEYDYIDLKANESVKNDNSQSHLSEISYIKDEQSKSMPAQISTFKQNSSDTTC